MTNVLIAYTAKQKLPYRVALREQHYRILKELSYYPTQGRTDAELLFGLRINQAGTRRCELRDLHFVRWTGKRSEGALTWKLTEAGYALLREFETKRNEATA